MRHNGFVSFKESPKRGEGTGDADKLLLWYHLSEARLLRKAHSAVVSPFSYLVSPRFLDSSCVASLSALPCP